MTTSRSILVKKPFSICLRDGSSQTTTFTPGKIITSESKLIMLAEDSDCELVEFTGKTEKKSAGTKKAATKPKTTEKGGKG